MNLREFSVAYEGFGGAVTWYMLPFRNLQVDVILAGLQKIDPQLQYIHTQTGEHTFDEPEQLVKDRERAKKIGAPFASVWRAEWLWTGRHEAFWQYYGATTDIDFRDGAQTAQIRSLRFFWEHRSENILDCWQMFNQLVSVDVYEEWRKAYKATRDTSMDAPKSDDPKAPVTASDTSKPSPKRKTTGR